MSLLTEEQVKDLAFEMSLRLPTNHSRVELIVYISEWNEKQKNFFDVRWNNAPPSATRAELQIAWYNNDNFLVSEDVLGYVPRPTKPHPHAEIIAKYAEVAARRCDPWVEFEWFDEAWNKWIGFREKVHMFSFDKIRHIGDKP